MINQPPDRNTLTLDICFQWSSIKLEHLSLLQLQQLYSALVPFLESKK